MGGPGAAHASARVEAEKGARTKTERQGSGLFRDGRGSWQGVREVADAVAFGVIAEDAKESVG